jgi:16S rRNA (guanine(1405)-N(7))-methyltransferase
VLLLKTLTTLEQQRAGAARDVLAALDAPRVVASLPRGSLSAGRRYADDPAVIVEKAAAGTGFEMADWAAFGDELVVLLARSGS